MCRIYNLSIGGDFSKSCYMGASTPPGMRSTGFAAVNSAYDEVVVNLMRGSCAGWRMVTWTWAAYQEKSRNDSCASGKKNA